MTQANEWMFKDTACAGSGTITSEWLPLAHISDAGAISCTLWCTGTTPAGSLSYQVSADGANPDSTTSSPSRLIKTVSSGVGDTSATRVTVGFNLPAAPYVRLTYTDTSTSTNIVVNARLHFIED